MAWNHEQFAFSVLPRNFQTDDILRRSCLEALKQEGLSMFQVLATVFEPEGKDRAPNKESSVIQKARAIVRVASWSRGHDPNFSSAGTERDSIHHCEEHWLPSATQENYKEDWLRTQNIPHVLQQRIWLKKIMFYPPPEIQKSTIEVQPAYIKTLPGFCCSVSQSCLSITISQSLLKLIPLGCWCHPTIVCSVTPSAPAFSSSQYQVFFCLFVCLFVFSQWVDSSHQEAKVLDFQHQFFQWIFRVDFP